MKVKTGFFSFTCCEGCTVVFIETLNKRYEKWMKKMNIVNFRALKKVQPISKMDIAFVEGAITNPREIDRLKEIRANTKKLIALGSGAVNGYPSNQRNSFNEELKREIQPLIKKFNQIEKISPLSEFVKVDGEIDGCPVDEDMLIKKIDGLLKNA